jgi:transmembrane sensor
MTDLEHATSDHDTLRREAQEWVMRLTSGEATSADSEALHRWRSRSRAHRRAFAEANLLWNKLWPAAASVDRHAGWAAAVGELKRPSADRLFGRRAFLGGALAAASAGYAVLHPPLRMWPSLAEITADYRTGTGQQRRVALDDSVSVTLNTQTSITVVPPQTAERAVEQIELISGEAAIATNPRSIRPFTVIAAQGRTVATNARFNVWHDGATVCVTCLEGEIRIETTGQASMVRARQQVVYTARDLNAAVDVDPEMVTAWERGLLVFRNNPLAHVIEQVNRYRSGKIILMNDALGRRPVLATFRIDRIDEVVPRLQIVFGVQVKAFPGGIVILS